ncbi:MAG: O-antigen ligase family protein, partial [Planctomycetales bacterium]|nr:O-antigen ligase family protein [Planctomycetales bacterium]
MQRHRFDYLFVLSVPWVALLSSVHGLRIGPLRHTGLFWLVTCFVGLILIALRGPRKINFPWQWWAPLYLFLFCSLFWSQMNWKYNLQLYFQMTVYPIVGIVASYAIESHAEMKRMLRDYAWVLWGILAAYLFYTYGPGQSVQGADEDLYVGFAARPAAMTLIVTGAIFLSQVARRPVHSVLMWFISFLTALLTGSRMVTLVVMSEWVTHPRLASIKARIGVVLLTMAIGLAAFNTPIIQDRFFMKKSGFSGKGTIGDVLKGKFDSAGRFDSWPKILEASQERPWFGHGVGESGPYVYSIWAPIDKPHNEYLKMFFDGGYTALACYLLGLFGTLAN